MTIERTVLTYLFAALLSTATIGAASASPDGDTPSGERPWNVVLILTDDHRYDAMGFMGHPFLETPNLDAMAAGGVHFRNAFVTTSLCSPSRASILTGMYMHNHGIVDNGSPIREMPTFFSEYLQEAGYQTAFVGKWHMGGASDEPQPGFDHWVSFRGQGQYYPPDDREWSLNVNGKRVPQRDYVTDEMTAYALEWLDGIDEERPFMLYLSHKGIHDDFSPARRHEGRYAEALFPEPVTMADTPENYDGKPMWVQNQRNSWHGVDFPYHHLRGGGAVELYRRYNEAMLSVDESVGRVLDWLDESGLDERTIVLYLGDNGFQWGEHGLIDKRTAYEASMRVPMLAYAPALFEPGSSVSELVANIDVAPTILDAAGLEIPADIDGASVLDLAAAPAEPVHWRDELLYEYYWEQTFPQTPTMYAIRTPRYKLIQYYGVWDVDELYDLKADPDERHNLINEPEAEATVAALRERLHALMRETEVQSIPLRPKRGRGQGLRSREGKGAADFPADIHR